MKSKPKKHLVPLGLIAAAATAGSSLAQRTPNILLIIADDVAADVCRVDNTDMRVTTLDDNIHLPGLSELAAGGIRFTRAYAEPTCTPTRASIYTGYHPWRSGATHPSGKTDNLPQNLVTIAELAPADYHCGLAGKWHLGSNAADDPATDYEGVQPQHHGWDNWAGHVGGKPDPSFSNWDYWHKDGSANYVSENLGVIRSGLTSYPPNVHLKNLKGAINLCKQTGKPFFLTYACSLAHEPFHDPDKPAKTSGTAAFYPEMVKRMDDNIVEILDHLQENEKLADTVIIFVGDNGTPGQIQINSTTTGQKMELSKAGLRVPLIIAEGKCVRTAAKTGTWIKQEKGGAHRRLVHVVDLYATIGNLMGLNGPGNKDSQTLFPYLQATGPTTRTYSFSQWGGLSDPLSESAWLIKQGGVLYRLNHVAETGGTGQWSFFADEEPILKMDIPQTVKDRFTAAMANSREVRTPDDTEDNRAFVSPF